MGRVKEHYSVCSSCGCFSAKAEEQGKRISALESALAQAVDELTKVFRYFNALDEHNAVNPFGAEMSARGAVRDSVFKKLEDILHKKQEKPGLTQDQKDRATFDHVSDPDGDSIQSYCLTCETKKPNCLCSELAASPGAHPNCSAKEYPSPSGMCPWCDACLGKK